MAAFQRIYEGPHEFYSLSYRGKLNLPGLDQNRALTSVSLSFLPVGTICDKVGAEWSNMTNNMIGPAAVSLVLGGGVEAQD